MSNLNKSKEKFLSNIQGVNRDEVFNIMGKNTEGLDLYTYFVSYGAFNTGDVDLSEIKEYILKLYADWYFLNRNNDTNANIIKLTHQSHYSPQNLNTNDCFDLVSSNKYSDILPIKIQYLNKLEDKFFTAIDLDKLYARKEGNNKYTARLYLNLPANTILDFIKEFVDRAYLSNWSGKIKFLSQDDRSDDVIIYTNFEYAEKIVAEIEDIITDYPYKYNNIGEVNPLLGKVNNHIGFGESPENNKTYFYSRCEALSKIGNTATNNIIKKYFVSPEKKVIFRNDGESYTPSEYLAFLIEKNATIMIDKTITKLKKENADSSKINSLYELKANLYDTIDIQKQVEKLKTSLTRNSKYTCSIEGVQEVEFDYIDKLYNLFNKTSDTYIQTIENSHKKKLVCEQIFKTTDEVFGENTKETLQGYFKLALEDALKEIIEQAKDDLNTTKHSPILTNLKQKKVDHLNKVLKLILSDDDGGKEYLDSCIFDYVRILSSGVMDNVEIYIDSDIVKLDNNISEDLLLTFPELLQDIDNLSKSPEYVNNILLDYDINMNDLCINKNTKYLSRDRIEETDSQPRFYYDPERIL